MSLGRGDSDFPVMPDKESIQKPQARARILVIDDESDLRDLLSEELALALPDSEILSAENGQVAFDLIQATAVDRPFDAILSDMNMPKLSGLQLLEKLRQEDILTPFVILTGFGDKESVVRALRLGAFDFLEKPYQSEKVTGVMKAAVELGVSLRNIELEVDELALKHRIDGAALAEFKRIQRKILAMSRMNTLNRVAPFQGTTKKVKIRESA